MRILILEDEIPAFEKLLSSLQSYFTESFEYDWGRSLVEFRSFLASNRSYDFILSDIQLLDGSVFDLLEHIDLNTPIIFCSAHDNYLLNAFNVNGIAYVLKPYTQQELEGALNKYNLLFTTGEYSLMNKSKAKIIKNSVEKIEKNFRNRFVVKKTEGIHLIKVDEVALIEAQGDFCKLIDHFGKLHTFSQNIGGVELSLDPQCFFRINRSQIVNIDHIVRIEKHFKNRLVLHLKGPKETVMTSSGQTAGFRAWLEG